mmetsp:Transcript_21540/g.38576  ORF Transcript_21540/g.38576 Transcript_21540/m.38576 type:complete len:163 (+) Transcript_21540:61-549(+)
MVTKVFSSLAMSMCIATILLIALSHNISPISAFTTPLKSSVHHAQTTSTRNNYYRSTTKPLASSSEDSTNRGVIDLTDDDEDENTATNTSATNTNTAAPFLSQGELSDDPNLLSPDFKDAKQTRVIIYIILTLVPILFLVPLMIGSRDLIPLDALPPVDISQ